MSRRWWSQGSTPMARETDLASIKEALADRASLVALVIDEITRSQHPEIAAPEGSQLLLLVEDD